MNLAESFNSMKLKKSGIDLSILNSDSTQGMGEKDAIEYINRQKKALNNDKVDGDKNDSDKSEKPSIIEIKTSLTDGNDSESSQSNSQTQEDVEADSQPETLTISKDEFQNLLTTALTQIVEPLKAELADTKTKLEATETQLEKSKSSSEIIVDLFKSASTSASTQTQKPAINPVSSTGDKISGAAKEFEEILSDRAQTPMRTWVDGMSGETFRQRDLRCASDFFHENRDILRNDMEKFAKSQGLLQSWRSNNNLDATTARTDIPDLLLDYLSMTVRETHEHTFIYWQFPFKGLELGKGPGDNIKVHRWGYLPEPTATTDRELTPGTSTTSQNQSISETSVSIALKERGLGKTTNAEPVAIPEFWMAYSMANLEAIVLRLLGHDYNADQDLMIRSLLFQTSRIYYNKSGELTTTVGNLGSGENGTFTETYLNSLGAQMFTDKIIPYSNGKYALILPPMPLKQLRNDLASKNRFIEKADMTDLSMVLNISGDTKMGGKVNGYVGDYGDFMIFTTNTHSVGNPGTVGVQNETTGAGSRTTRTGIAMGAAAIAEATGMDVQIRNDNNNDFGRLKRWIWIAHKGYGHLDTDPAINASQQLRVVQTRTLDLAL